MKKDGKMMLEKFLVETIPDQSITVEFQEALMSEDRDLSRRLWTMVMQLP